MNAGPPFYEDKPELRNCPQCGTPLVNSVPRGEVDGDGNPEIVRVYLCLAHGFYSFRPSEGMRRGL